MVQFTWPRWIISGLVLALVACAGVGISVSEPAETGDQVPVVEPVEIAEQATAPTPLPAATNTPTSAPTATAVTVPATATPTEAPTVAEAPATAMPEPAIVPAGPTEEQARLLASLPAKGPAPELFNEVWLNSEPLKLADLRGKVVIVEFWTFG